MLNAKKGISAAQLQRDLGIGGYKTAWYLKHRIREAMAEGAIPKLGGIVEIDETYVGGKYRGRRGAKKDKDVVMGIRERGGAEGTTGRSGEHDAEKRSESSPRTHTRLLF